VAEGGGKAANQIIGYQIII